ncbi:Islet cell autoantigen 1 [Sarcoptes scabiei]|nr:Islet cell autoantigen 1 [Sarcoptes scabiei]
MDETTNIDCNLSIFSDNGDHDGECDVEQKKTNIFKDDKIENDSTDDREDSLGLELIPSQIRRNFIKKEKFSFTMMIVGPSGLGKSTFINSFFMFDLYNQQYPGPTERFGKTLTIDTTSVLIKQEPIDVFLTIVDTPGFGDQLDNSDCWKSIETFIEKKYDEFLDAQLHFDHKPIVDNRVHCCLYFIQPTGQALKQIDIQFLKHLHDKVNIIPIIAKADSMSPQELSDFKTRIICDLKQNEITIYDFPLESCPDSDHNIVSSFRKRIPFAIVSSNRLIEQNGRIFHGRKYPWGIVNVEDLNHCDFKALRELLIKHHMYDLVHRTNTVHYEKFCQQHLKCKYRIRKNFQFRSNEYI